MPILSQPVLDLIRHSYDSYITLQYHKLYYSNTLFAATVIIVVALVLNIILKAVREDMKNIYK